MISRTNITTAAIALAMALLVFAFRQGGYLQRVEHQVADTRAALLRREVSSDIVIVGIDARSLAELHTWPWPRQNHAALLQQLRAANPRQIFLDIDFSSASTADQDAQLQSELAQWPRSQLILPAFFQPATGSDANLVMTQPIPSFRSHVSLAAVNQLVDEDGLVRRFRTNWVSAGATLPSVATVLSQYRNDGQHQSSDDLLIDFSISPASFDYLSYSDVLRGDFDASSLQGKTILIGATASELNDMISVPQYQALAGSVVQALAAQTIINGIVHTPTTGFYLVGPILWALLITAVFSRSTWQRNLLTLCIAIALPLAASVYLYARQRIAMEVVPWAVVAVLCFAAVTIRSLNRETLRSIALALGVRRRDALMASIVESSTDGILCIDDQGVIRTTNPAGARLFAGDHHALLGTNILSLIDMSAGDAAVLPALLGGINECSATATNGRSFPVEYSVCRVGLHEERLYTVIVRDISDRKAQERKLQHQATHDSLTTLPNRPALINHLERALAMAQPDQQVALLMLDLCHFKEVNDTLGHDVGDVVLTQVAQRFRTVVGDRGLLARIGGDEFTIVLDQPLDNESIDRLATALATDMQSPIYAGAIAIELGVSIGVALYPQHAADAQTLLKNADIAMYVAKRRGISHEYYDSTHNEHSVRKLTMAAELRHAIALDQLQLCFQPQVNLRNGRVESAEALLRWHHPQLGHVNPMEFIAIAESTDLIQPLTLWTLRNTLQQLRYWRQLGVELRIAVNLSARLLQDVTFPDQLHALLATSGVPASALELEITESAMMLDPDRALSVIKKIYATGVSVSVDDYGTGFSSLGYLRDLPLHALKLDKSFVLPMQECARDRVIVESTVQLAHALNLMVVGEGVETEWHARFLAEAGYDYAQGFHYSRALPADAFLNWLQNFGASASIDATTPVPVAGAA